MLVTTTELDAIVVAARESSKGGVSRGDVMIPDADPTWEQHTRAGFNRVKRVEENNVESD